MASRRVVFVLNGSEGSPTDYVEHRQSTSWRLKDRRYISRLGRNIARS